MKKTLLVFYVCLFALHARAWKITQIAGDVQVISNSKNTRAKTGLELRDQEVIQTGTDGKAVIEDRGAKIFIAAKSKIQLETTGASGSFAIDAGKIRGLIEKFDKGDYPYRFKTPTVVMGVRGTEFFIAHEDGEEKFCTLTGTIHVELINPKDKNQPSWWNLNKGQGLFITKGQPTVKTTSDDQQANWIKLTTF